MAGRRAVGRGGKRLQSPSEQGLFLTASTEIDGDWYGWCCRLTPNLEPRPLVAGIEVMWTRLCVSELSEVLSRNPPRRGDLARSWR